jgi:Disulphide bond corrector protein DsbC
MKRTTANTSLTLSFFFVFAVSGCIIHDPVHPRNDGAPPSFSPVRTGISSSADVVKVFSPEVTIAPKGSAEAIVTLSISPGYHVNANPATFSYLIATAISPGQAEGITPGKPVYPVAQKKKFQFADEPLAVYEGDVQVKLSLSAAANANKGARSLPIEVRVQACDNEKCYAPDTLRTTITVDVK